MAYKTVSDSLIASFIGNDKSVIDDVVVDFAPVQDLHGYNKPWSVGGSNNLLPTFTEDASSNNVTLKVNPDGSVSLSGTSSATTTFDAPVGTWRWDGEEDCWLSGCPAGGDVSFGYSLRVQKLSGSDGFSDYDVGNGIALANFSSSKSIVDASIGFRIVIRSGVNCDGLVFRPMLNKGSSAQPFAPYSNICPIIGVDECNLCVTGINIFDEEFESGYYDATTGEKASSSTQIRSKNKMVVKPNTSYYLHFSPSSGARILQYKSDGTFIRADTLKNTAFTTDQECHYIALNLFSAYGKVYQNDLSINYPATDIDYHAYVGTVYNIEFPSEAGTVYFGTLDTNGTLTLTHECIELDGTDFDYWNTSNNGTKYVRSSGTRFARLVSSARNCMCNQYGVFGVVADGSVRNLNSNIVVYDNTLSDLATAQAKFNANHLQYVSPLNTPLVCQLTPVSIAVPVDASLQDSIINVFSNEANSIEVSYWDGAVPLIKLNNAECTSYFVPRGMRVQYKKVLGRNGGTYLSGEREEDVLAWKAVVKLICMPFNGEQQADFLSKVTVDDPTLYYFDPRTNGYRTIHYMADLAETQHRGKGSNTIDYWTGLVLTAEEK